MTTQTTAGFT